MARDISGQSISDIKKAIAEQQEMISLSMTGDTSPKGVKVGWTDASGEYQEVGRTIQVKTVARLHNEGLSNGHGGFHTEHRYIEQTELWVRETQMQLLTKAAMADMVGNKGESLNILTRIGDNAKEYLRTLIMKYKLVDTTRLMNSIVIEYIDNSGNVIGG